MAKRKPRKPGTAVQSFMLSTEALNAVHPDPAKQKLLVGYLRHGTIAAACAHAHVDRKTWYNWLEADPAFAALAADAHEAVVDHLELTAMKRATATKNASDTLLIFLLKAHRRGKFGDRQTITLFSPEIQVALRATVELIASQPTWDSTELLARVEAFWK